MSAMVSLNNGRHFGRRLIRSAIRSLQVPGRIRGDVSGAKQLCVYSHIASQRIIMTDELAQLFLKYDYPETKDLCKQFLTLVVAVLVFSLTFSEKIADFPRASNTTKALL